MVVRNYNPKNLYYTLEFSNNSTFNKAFTLFCQKPHIGNTMRHLHLCMLDFDDKIDSLLIPIYIPNIKALNCLKIGGQKKL
jgi:hypothetical protein